MSKVNFFKLTAAQYDSLENKDADTIYFLTDHKIIVLGAEKYINEKKADKFLVKRVFAHDTYGTVKVSPPTFSTIFPVISGVTETSHNSN